MKKAFSSFAIKQWCDRDYDSIKIHLHGTVLTVYTSFTKRTSNTTDRVFKLTELPEMYHNRLMGLGEFFFI